MYTFQWWFLTNTSCFSERLAWNDCLFMIQVLISVQLCLQTSSVTEYETRKFKTMPCSRRISISISRFPFWYWRRKNENMWKQFYQATTIFEHGWLARRASWKIVPKSSKNYSQVEWLKFRAILSAWNFACKDLNREISKLFSGTTRLLTSADSVVAEDPDQQNSLNLQYPVELLNSMEGDSSLPDHEIELKKGFLVMLLRNICPDRGHVNGARYVVVDMTDNLLFLKSVSGTH